MKILYIQYATEFAEDFTCIVKKGGKENYYGQEYSVRAVAEQAQSGHVIKIISMHSETPVDMQLDDKLFFHAFPVGKPDMAGIMKATCDFAPDRVILRIPDQRLMKFLRRQQIPTLMLLADSFETVENLRQRINRFRLAREFRNDFFRWIGNHQINACRSLARLGVSADKILPYDWVHPQTPADWPRADTPAARGPTLRLFFAGNLARVKGSHELAAAVRDLNAQGIPATLTLAGKGDPQEVLASAQIPAENGYVTFLGLIPHEEVLRQMHLADFTVVPSHHAFPEGLPMTIMESLMVGTPVIASDHPMFVGRVGNRGAVRFFRERDAADLTRVIRDTWADETAFAAAAANTAAEWHDLELDLKWADLVNDWIAAPDTVDFSRYALSRIQQP